MEARVERACIHRVSGDERERKEEVLVTYLGLGGGGPRHLPRPRHCPPNRRRQAPVIEEEVRP